MTALWLLAYAAVTALSFPHAMPESAVSAGGVLDLGVVLAWFGPVCLALALARQRPLHAGLLAFAGGWLAHTLVFHWIYIAAVRYGGAHPAVGGIAVGGLALYPALFVALFGAGWAQLLRASVSQKAEGIWVPLAGAALWVAMDHARSFVLTGFPWALLGYAQHENSLLLALAPWAGVYGISFVTAAVGLALGCALTGRDLSDRSPGKFRRALSTAAGVFVVAHLLGALALFRSPEAEGPLLRIGIAQGNIDQGEKWDPESARRTLETYEALTREAAARGAQMVLWPETAAPGFPEPVPPGLSDNPLRSRLHALSDETGAVLVVGALGGDPDTPHDSAFVFSPGSDTWQRYDKAHLVPFGEYLPMRPWIGRFVNAIARGSANTDVRAGPGPATVSLGGLASAGTPICYELLFPDLVRRFRVEGAELLLAMTNDAWYGRSGAPYQFLAITAFRAAEGRLWTARAANTGVSAFIDDRGRIREQSEIFERALLVADVPRRAAPTAGGLSLYTRFGDWWAWLCWGVATLALGWSLAPRRAQPSDDAPTTQDNREETG